MHTLGQDVDTAIIDAFFLKFQSNQLCSSEAQLSWFELGQNTKSKLGCNTANAMILCRDYCKVMPLMPSGDDIYTMSILDKSIASEVLKHGTQRDRNVLFQALKDEIQAKKLTGKCKLDDSERSAFVVDVRARKNGKQRDFYVKPKIGKQKQQMRSLKEIMKCFGAKEG